VKELFGITVLHVSTVCKNHCESCFLVDYKSAIAKLDYMEEVVDYVASRSFIPIMDVAGKDITFNPDLIEFLEYCGRKGVVTSATLGTPQSIGVASEIFRLVKAPRISLDGTKAFADDYRGEGNYDSFCKLMELAEKANALNRLKVVFTAVPDRKSGVPNELVEGNIKPHILHEILRTVRTLGQGRVKLLVNPINNGGYSKEEISLLRWFGRQSCVEFSLAKQILLSVEGISKGCLCQAPKTLTFSADQELIAPCFLLPKHLIPIEHGIDAVLRSDQWQEATLLCGSDERCKNCWASCYHLPGVFLEPKLKFVLPHLLSCPPIQNVRDRILAAFGQIRPSQNDRYPNCPRLFGDTE
jgi:hypothetical protein